MTHFRNLTKTVSPPNQIVDKPSKLVWSKFENEMQLKTPEDIKLLLETYGSGCFGDFLHLLVPYASNRFLCMKNKLHELSTFHRNYQATVTGKVPLSPYKMPPQKGALAPWAITDNGDYLFFYPHENTYKTVMSDMRMHEWEEYDCSATEFLLNVFTAKLVAETFPDDFPMVGKIQFEPTLIKP